MSVKKVAIVGVGESDQMGHVPSKSPLQHHSEAAYNALADAGIKKSEVDGLFTAGYSTLLTAEYMGIVPRYTDSTSIGGSSFIAHVGHAVAAIQAGYCNVALITHGQSGYSRRGQGGQPDLTLPKSQYEAPYGLIGNVIDYALACSRYMYEFGEERTRQGMAEIAVATRKWAQLNPKAFMQDPMTFEDYHSSRWIAWPFHLLDCCLVTDAGGAVVITSNDKVASCRKSPVWILGTAESHEHSMISQMPSLTSTIARQTGPTALMRAGVTHDDIDLAMIYDSFTYTVLASLEALGFCGQGEGPDFVANQRTAPGGTFPMNTNGGGLSYTHSGMYGIFLLIEAVRQLRGEAGSRQVYSPKNTQNPARLTLVNGTGGSLSSTATTILASD
jgi:acetyl-CoA acetyltransferase